MRTTVKGVAAFFILTFGLAWGIWGVPIGLGASPNSRLFQFAVLIGAFTPALGAVLVRTLVTGEGFADAGLGLHLCKWSYHIAAWLIPLAVVAFIVVVALLLHLGEPDLTLKGVLAIVPLTVVSLISTPILWGEEFGWRSYLQLRLFPSKPLLAAIITGLTWGVWHFPLLLQVPELPLHPAITLVLFPLGTILYSIVLGWLRLKSGSIWTSSFCHSAINNLRSPLIAILFAAQTDMLPIALVGMAGFAVIALAIVAVGGLRPAPQSLIDAAQKSVP